MLKFNRNKNQAFKRKISIRGAGKDPNVKTRLILSPTDSTTHLFFEGTYNGSECEINIPSIVDVGNSGDVILEIIANNTVFQPWKDTFEILSETVMVESVSLVDRENEIIIEVDTKPTKKVIKTIKIDKMFKPKVSRKTIKEINEYITMTKKIKNKKGKVKLLKEIVTFYKPNKSILKWASNIFTDVKEPKAKIAMYCKQLVVKKLKESRDTQLKKNFPDIEEWTNDRRGSSIHWNVVSKRKWDDGRAGQFQASIGYDPSGYGLMKFKTNKNIDGTFTMTWECSSSSD